MPAASDEKAFWNGAPIRFRFTSTSLDRRSSGDDVSSALALSATE